MSKYTTEVRYIVETANNLTESAGFDDVDELIENACPNIFSFDFPIFDELYRLPLEKKILMHYYTREISEETVGLWKLRLCTRLREIMPYYNKLYNSELLVFNPLYDVDYTTTGQRTGDEENTNMTVNDSERISKETEKGTSNDSAVTNRAGNREQSDSGHSDSANSYAGTSTTDDTKRDIENQNSTHWTMYSDTPQGGINGIEGGVDITTGVDPQTVESLYYLTNATKETNTANRTDNITGHSENSATSADSTHQTDSHNSNIDYSEGVTANTAKNNELDRDVNTTNTGKTASTGTIKNVNDYTEHVIGKRGVNSYSHMLLEFRKTFLNIDMMIINDLKDLFFGLWA